MVLKVHCGGKRMVPQNVHVLILLPNEYVAFQGKKHFAYVVKVEDLEMGDYLGLSRWILSHHKSPLNQRTFLSCIQRKSHDD